MRKIFTAGLLGGISFFIWTLVPWTNRTWRMAETGGLPPATVLGKALAFDIAAALIASLLLAKTGPKPGYWGRVSFATLMGLFAGIVSRVSDWLWLGAPAARTFQLAADLAIGWTLAGLAIAAVVRPAATAPGDGVLFGVVDPG